MAQNPAKKPLTGKAVAAAKPSASEYTLWDGALAHFGVRVQPSGVRSFIVQVRVNGRMRKFTLGRFPETSLGDARKEAAALLARVWTGESVPERKVKAPLVRDFAAAYRERRRSRWKPSSLKTHDIYMRNRLMPGFGRLRLDAIDQARVSAWFDAVSADRPGAANRAFEILRAMLAAAPSGASSRAVPTPRQIRKNPRRPGACPRHDAESLGRGAERRARSSRAGRACCDPDPGPAPEVAQPRKESKSRLRSRRERAPRRLKTGPRTLWFGPEVVAGPRGAPGRDGAARVLSRKTSIRPALRLLGGVRGEPGCAASALGRPPNYARSGA